MNNLQIIVDASTLEQILTFGFLSFLVAMALKPLYTTAAFAGRWWKKPRTHTITGEVATLFR